MGRTRVSAGSPQARSDPASPLSRAPAPPRGRPAADIGGKPGKAERNGLRQGSRCGPPQAPCPRIAEAAHPRLADRAESGDSGTRGLSHQPTGPQEREPLRGPLATRVRHAPHCWPSRRLGHARERAEGPLGLVWATGGRFRWRWHSGSPVEATSGTPDWARGPGRHAPFSWEGCRGRLRPQGGDSAQGKLHRAPCLGGSRAVPEPRELEGEGKGFPMRLHPGEAHRAGRPAQPSPRGKAGAGELGAERTGLPTCSL